MGQLRTANKRHKRIYSTAKTATPVTAAAPAKKAATAKGAKPAKAAKPA